jgi:hypothetical protein
VISIFPNPVIDELNITLAGATNFEITLISVTGERIMTIENQNNIDVSALAAGVYFIEISTTDYTVREKFVKQ